MTLLIIIAIFAIVLAFIVPPKNRGDLLFEAAVAAIAMLALVSLAGCDFSNGKHHGLEVQDNDGNRYILIHGAASENYRVIEMEVLP